MMPAFDVSWLLPTFQHCMRKTRYPGKTSNVAGGTNLFPLLFAGKVENQANPLQENFWLFGIGQQDSSTHGMAFQDVFIFQIDISLQNLITLSIVSRAMSYVVLLRLASVY